MSDTTTLLEQELSFKTNKQTNTKLLFNTGQQLFLVMGLLLHLSSK